MSIKPQENLNEKLKKTPLFFEHKKLRAKMVPFAGWEMPVQYSSGLLAEHNTVRTSVGLFDVSHMGEIEIRGKESTKFLQELTLNDASLISDGQAQYNGICNEQGKVLDDIIVYKRNLYNYFICVNAANREKDFNWFKKHSAKYKIDVLDLSERYGQIAIQGPKSKKVMEQLVGNKILDLKYFHFLELKIFEKESIVARTGYTGELGYEIYCPAEITEQVWNQLLGQGKSFSLLPCGLGARDILRLEVGYLLYGSDMDENTTALECGLKWITKFTKPEFMGKQALIRQSESGIEKKLVGFEMCDRAIGRHGYKVFSAQDAEQEIGMVTSGTPSPTLSKNIGLMYVKSNFSKIGTDVLIEVRGSLKPARIVKKVFYTSGSVHS